MNTTVLQLIDGTRIVVPDSIGQMTSYVLCEQQDWFEDEIRFLRRLLRPGQKVVDIGANHGVYGLSMARAVGPSGRVWCFEPASTTAALLAQGIAANGYNQVKLHQQALSSATGTARFSRYEASELNGLVHDPAANGPIESVEVTTLDDCLDSCGWHDLAFLKIDAEGEETHILQGGRRTLEQLSPLIQYEVKAGHELHLDLVEAFAGLGYRSYRLVPSLDLLVPFSEATPPDSYLLNLFCCKADRATELAAQGHLLRDLPSTAPTTSAHRSWRPFLTALPFGRRLAGLWEGSAGRRPRQEENESALAHFYRSRDAGLPAAERFASLEAGLSTMQTLCRDDESSLRLASLARMARAFGARDIAVEALNKLAAAIQREGRTDPSEPFLAPAARFEEIDPGDRIGDWILAATLEELEQVSSFSSYFTGAAALPRLERIHRLGFAGAEMQRRLLLVKRRCGLA